MDLVGSTSPVKNHSISMNPFEVMQLVGTKRSKYFSTIPIILIYFKIGSWIVEI